MPSTQERERIGSSSPRKRKAPLAWVPWLALLLLLLVAGLAWLLMANVTDENDRSGVDLGDDEVAAGSPAADAGGTNCPSATDAGQELFTGLAGIVGCRVDVQATVGDVADDNTFTVTDGSKAVLVVDGSKGTVLERGQRIRMTGTVRVFHFDEVADELDLEKSRSDYERFEGKTVVVADSTRPA